MKKVLCAALVLILLTLICGCAPKTLTPAVHEKPMEEYEALAEAGNAQAIAVLIQDLAAAEDFEQAAEVVNAESAASRYPLDIVGLGTIFAGCEDMVALETWTACYTDDSPGGEEKELEAEIEAMRVYNAAIRLYYEDDWAAFQYVLENANRCVRDMDSVRLAECGTAPDGKALVYFRRSPYSDWMLGASAALPTSLIPASLDEVEYVIMIDETLTSVGTYTNGAAAKRCDYTVSLIRYPGGEELSRSSPIEGERPPQAINENQSGGTGDPPEADSVATALEAALSWLSRE